MTSYDPGLEGESRQKSRQTVGTRTQLFRVGICSGYFNPLHVGHLEYLRESRSKCDFLYVIVNNDSQVRLKGSVPFMSESDRSVIVKALHCVDDVVISIDNDLSVSQTLDFIGRSHKCSMAFFNSGDRAIPNPQENDVCKLLNIEQIFLGQPKIESSSRLLKNTEKIA